MTMPKIKEMAKDFFYTTPEQMHDERRELKAFFGGILVASVAFGMILASVLSSRCI